MHSFSIATTKILNSLLSRKKKRERDTKTLVQNNTKPEKCLENYLILTEMNKQGIYNEIII